MGGIIIIAAILIPTLLFAQLDNVYVILLIIATCWLGIIGFVDDYIKVFRKNKEGLAGRFKVVGQVGLGLIVGFTLYFNTQVVIREVIPSRAPAMVENNEGTSQINLSYREVKSTKTTVPFLKNNEFDYSSLIPFLPVDYTWIVYVGVVIFVIIAVSNGANITDGIDGLAAGTSAIIGLTIAILAYVSGRIDFSSYLNIMYIPNLGEVVVFCTAFDEYSIQAFKQNGVDYVLKPFSREDIVEAFKKVDALKNFFQQKLMPDLRQLLSKLSTTSGKTSFLVFRNQKYTTIHIDNIAFFHIRNDATCIMCFDKQEYVISESLEQIAQQVSPQQFFRINRQCLLNFAAIKEVEHFFLRKLHIKLVIETKEKLLVNKEKATRFLTWMEER